MQSGGSASESNRASPRVQGATDFEDREGHRAPFASELDFTSTELRVASATDPQAYDDRATATEFQEQLAGWAGRIPKRRSAPPLTPALRRTRSAETIYPSINRTSPARGPFCDSSGVNSTRCPSRSSSNTAPRTELRWKKCSIPPSSRMNPNPLSIRSRAIVPVGITRSPPFRTPQGYPKGTQPVTGACGRSLQPWDASRPSLSDS